MMLPSTTCVEIENGLNPTPPPPQKKENHTELSLQEVIYIFMGDVLIGDRL